jgi:hypothetical protein
MLNFMPAVFLLSVCLDSAILVLSEQTLGPAAVAAELLNLVQLYSRTRYL